MVTGKYKCGENEKISELSDSFDLVSKLGGKAVIWIRENME